MQREASSMLHCWFCPSRLWLGNAYTIRMHGLRLAPQPLSLQKETSLFTVDNWGLMNNCSESEGALCTTSREGKEERRWGGGPQGDISCSISASLFFFFCVHDHVRLSFLFSSFSSPLSLLTPELKMLEGPESHRGVIRVCCSPSVLRSPSSLSPPLQASHTVEGRSSLALCSRVGLCLKPLWPRKLFCSRGAPH